MHEQISGMTGASGKSMWRVADWLAEGNALTTPVTTRWVVANSVKNYLLVKLR